MSRGIGIPLLFEEIATPTENPPTGEHFFYLKNDGNIYKKNSQGVETLISRRNVKFVEANITLDDNDTNTWLVRDVQTAPPNTQISIIITSNSNNKTAGVRSVGSTRNLTAKQDSDSHFSMTVTTNSNSQIETFGNSNDLDFKFVGYSIIE